MQQPPPEPRDPLLAPPQFRADGLTEPEEAPDPRDLSDDERASSWLHAGLGLEVG